MKNKVPTPKNPPPPPPDPKLKYFDIALRVAGIELCKELRERVYKVAVLVHEKGDKATMKDVLFVINNPS